MTSARARIVAAGSTVAVHVVGAAAFLYPFVLPARAPGEGAPHGSAAPVLFAVVVLAAVAIAAASVRAGALDVREIALLGVLAGVNAALRLPGSFGGASPMYVLPILCGYVFGGRFGFLLGTSSFAASAVITGGVGPWLPFQMWALGWIGAGAGALRRPFARAPRGAAAVAVLAAYGWVGGLAFGAITNLWFWPFLGGGPELGWQPGMGAARAAENYWRFYLLTSLGWDAMRALGNLLLIALLGAPMLRLLIRYRERLGAVLVPAAEGPDVEARVA